MFLSKKSALKWMLLALSLLPAGLFAYQGSFSRAIADDFTYLAVGQQQGPIRSILFWPGVDNYSFHLMIGIVAPLDTFLATIMPIALVFLLMIGTAWLLFELLPILKIEHDRLAVSIVISALAVTASINALYIPHAFFWFSANARYLLPMSLLVINLAILFRFGRSIHHRLGFLRFMLFIALYSFIMAGFSEMHALFQVTVMSLLLLFHFTFANRNVPYPLGYTIGVGWAAAFSGLILHLTSASAMNRMARNEETGIWSPARTLPELISGTIDRTFQLVGHQEAFAGFMLLFAAGLFLAIRLYTPVTNGSAGRAPHLYAPPLWLGLIAQLCFLPIFWTHISDNPQFFSRFSAPFLTAVSLNLLVIIAFASLIWQRGRLASLLSRYASGWWSYVSIMLVFAMCVFGMTQLRSIHFKAATYLFTTALTILVILCWQSLAIVNVNRIRKVFLYAILWQLATVICSASLVVALLYTQGGIQPRVLSAIAFMQVVAGLFWGLSLGMCFKQFSLRCVACQAWIARFSWLSVALALIIGAGIVIGHARSVPRLAAFANEWDERHALMRQWAESGRTDAVVPQLSVDIAEFFCCSNESSAENANYYYGFKSLALNWDAS